MKAFRAMVGLAALLSVAGCRGQISSEPPVHLNPNMDSQPRYDAQAESTFFADGRVMRTPPKGTVPIGFLHADDAIEKGIDEQGQPVDFIPIKVDEALIAQGQEQFDIYCAPCHAKIGDGDGLVGRRWPFPVPDFHDQGRFDGVTDGRIYAAIYNGFNTMPSYRHQIPDAQDRWAVVAYVRTLQRAYATSKDEVPAQKLAELK